MKPSAQQTKAPVEKGAGVSPKLSSKLANTPDMRELFRRAQNQLRLQKSQKLPCAHPQSEVDARRLLQELEVHQVELELQNTELEEARNRLEVLLDKYTDLYDFAPVGYVSLNEPGQVLEINLTGAALLGVGRSRIINRPLLNYVTLSDRAAYSAFVKKVFAVAGKQVCEVKLLRTGGAAFWANVHGAAAVSASGPLRWCRIVISDITALKLSEEAQLRVEALAHANQELRREIVRRQVLEISLKKSEQHQKQLLAQSRVMQEQLRHLSRQVLQAQEEERRRISRELHDVIAQTLTGINVQLAALAKQTRLNPREFDRSIALTQRLVEKSVDIVHRFARELRPAVLDDLGLIPALHSFMKNFTDQTGVRAHLTAFAGVEQLDMNRRTVLFRVAQEALTNVARHARASKVDVSIQKIAGRVCLKIHDDGKAFQAPQMLQSKGGKRLGLLGMRERLEMVGGSFEVGSWPGEGTTVLAQLPLGNAGGGNRKLKSYETNHSPPGR
jgi:PAS domain S-box-containing protein